MRKASDRICAEHGLSILEPYVQTYEKKAIGTREYRAALKDESWKIRLIRDINTAMTRCGSREEFCDLMCSVGYSVTWEDSRKYITYTCPNGMKVRNNKLHDEKYLRENMEDKFRIREKNTTGQSIEQVKGIYTDNGNAISADRICDSERGMERVPRLGEGSRNLSANDLPKDIDTDNDGRQCADSRRPDGGTGKDSEKCALRDGENDVEHSLRARTGWENERAVYDRFLRGNEATNREIRHLVFEDAEIYDHHDRSDSHGSSAPMYNRLSLDEINAFFSDEPEDWDDTAEDDLYVIGKRYMLSKNVPKAIEYFVRSASEGNIYSYRALCRMNENVIIALTTDTAYIVSGLAGLFQDSMPIEDSTTLPHYREKKKHGHKQSM